MDTTAIILGLQTTAALKSVLVFLLPMAGSVLLMYGVFHVAIDLRSSARKKIIDRLKGGGERGGKDKQFNLEELRKQTAEATGLLARAFNKMSFTHRFQRTLEQANIPWSAPKTLVNLSALASMLLAGLLVFQVGLAAACGAAGAVFVLPVLYFFRRRKKRLKKLMEQLPDVFELLSQALRAGHSLASGMQLIAEELPEPAGTEFGRVWHEQNLGVKMEDALRNLSERVDVLDVRFFVTAVLIQRQVGGDLAEVLDKIGKVIRERIQLYGAVQALTAEGRLSGYVLLALPVIVLLVMLKVNHDYAMLLFTDPLGKMMLTTAIVMQLLGWAMIKKIVNIKV